MNPLASRRTRRSSTLALSVASLAFTLCAVGPRAVQAQPFVLDETASAVVANVYYSSVAWGDYDGDGDLDLVVTGRGAGSSRVGAMYRNDGSGGLTLDEAASAVIADVTSSSVAWGDYDGDGDLDLVVTGAGAGFVPMGEVYRNDGAGGLTLDAAASAVVADVSSGSVAWGDYDGDGDLDLVVTGEGVDIKVGGVYRNDGAGGLTVDAAASAVVADVVGSSVAWGDYDGDGDPDLVLSAGGSSFECCPPAYGELYRNDGAGGLTLDEAASAVIADGGFGSLAWGDYDGDGDLDLVVTGLIGAPGGGEVYRNDGAGGLTLDEAASAVVPDVYFGSLAWGDYDGDGDLDLVVTGTGGAGGLYRNDGAGGLTLDAATSAVVANVNRSSVAWGDYDGDGDLDLVVTGCAAGFCSVRVGEVYRNERAPTTAGEGGPGAVALALEAYPNPLAGSGTIRLRLPEAASAEVAVYDVLGRRVAVLHDGTLAAGDHAFGTPSVRLTPGVYVVHARVSGPGAERVLTHRVLTQKLTVLR